MTLFTDMGLSRPILDALAAEGYEKPTPIQAQAIPSVLVGKDLLGIAQTGTGKTAAFALPLLNRLSADPKPTPRKGCRVLVLSPTRELASQIADSFRAYGKFLKLTANVVFGGVPVNRQIREMANGVDILVATPGRLLDLCNQRAVDLSKIEAFVLDEADQMLDMGFIHDIRKLIALIPKQRQSLFFSATMPKEIAELADKLLKDPVKVAVTPVATTAERVEQSVLLVDTAHKQALLHLLLQNDPSIERALVFTRTKHGADKVVRKLAAAGHVAAAIHGNKSQNHRERSLAAFRAGEARLLVATDIAARGIDVDGVTHVINFDLPNVPESYVHRIGRTARAGAAGIAISFCDREERAYLRDIERVTRQRVPQADLPAGLAAAAEEEAKRTASQPREERRDDRGGRNGRGQQGRGGRPGGQGQNRQGQRSAQARPQGERPAAQGQGGRPQRDDQRARPQGEARHRPNQDHRQGDHRQADHRGGERQNQRQGEPRRNGGSDGARALELWGAGGASGRGQRHPRPQGGKPGGQPRREGRPAR
ncbi:RNA helicase [Alsobacter soli]|uniref:DEAD-box ATP-dependent RNA helicase RhpA n=1 Tax=Alsobacter soli TaxID=2109933 RepID=A0A2T1HR08_9HYPH|nr:DEAD/DEAH box helicase [Alsobacter soli]PSC03949.1 RNA helicase [Alsobacter soli]